MGSGPCGCGRGAAAPQPRQPARALGGRGKVWTGWLDQWQVNPAMDGTRLALGKGVAAGLCFSAAGPIFYLLGPSSRCRGALASSPLRCLPRSPDTRRARCTIPARDRGQVGVSGPFPEDQGPFAGSSPRLACWGLGRLRQNPPPELRQGVGLVPSSRLPPQTLESDSSAPHPRGGGVAAARQVRGRGNRQTEAQRKSDDFLKWTPFPSSLFFFISPPLFWWGGGGQSEQTSLLLLWGLE